MVTRGYYIGQIIDELSSITEKVRNRAKLGLTDIHIHLENFYKEILNITCGLKLENLNEERKNNPGLDLGDNVKSIAFQITGTKGSEKINQTLKKAVKYGTKFQRIIILTLQNKQDSYTIKLDLAEPWCFTDKDIWDVNDILNKVMHLKIDSLQILSGLISKELAKITIELEIPDENGQYQTNIDNYVEHIPKERFSGVSAYFDFHSSKDEPFNLTKEDTEYDFKLLISTLKKLPRITRQFYAMIYARCEWNDNDEWNNKYISEEYLKRICSFPDMGGELRLLGEVGLIEVDDREDDMEVKKILINFPRESKSCYFLYEFYQFIDAKEVSLENVLVTLDFSKFN